MGAVTRTAEILLNKGTISAAEMLLELGEMLQGVSPIENPRVEASRGPSDSAERRNLTA
jgi:hypothetical protein